MPSPEASPETCRDPKSSRSSRYALRERSKVKAPFEVPEWAGKNKINTCIIDSFLATLLCGKWRDPTFPSLVKGRSKFTEACREFLEAGDCDLGDRKDEFIEKLFKPDKHGEFDLEGDEASVILDKAKEACTIAISSKCETCGLEAESRNDYYYTGREERDLTELLRKAITRLDRSHRCRDTKLCNIEVEKKMALSISETTWMIPFDLSQMGLPPEKISSLPHAVEVAGGTFRLRGVSLFGAAHYTCILYDDTDWYYYDGIETPSIKVISGSKSLAPYSYMQIKIAYYLRVH